MNNRIIQTTKTTTHTHFYKQGLDGELSKQLFPPFLTFFYELSTNTKKTFYATTLSKICFLSKNLFKSDLGLMGNSQSGCC
jgi:hypothetical protein